MKDETSQSPLKLGRRAFLGTAGALAAMSVAAQGSVALAEAPADKTPDGAAGLPRVKQKLVAPPFFPEHEQVAKGGPKIVEVTLTVHEKKVAVDDQGAQIWAFAYNGSVPGPMIVLHEGDYLELTLRNPSSNTLMHNIDCHASTGALGSGGLTHVEPGQEVVVRWKAIKPGVFVYHCAPGGIMAPYHVVHGMNGAVMVLPRNGLTDRAGRPLRYDRAYYVGEQDYYLPRDKNGKFKTYERAGDDLPDSLEAMRGLIPTHVVFNGAIGALTGQNALKAKVGETLLIVHSQANRDSRPHLIGGHGDYVWEQGKFGVDNPPAEGLETWFIRGGSAGAMMYTFRQPGLYLYLNHDLITAFMLGAMAHVQVEGKWNDNLMTQVAKPHSYHEG